MRWSSVSTARSGLLMLFLAVTAAAQVSTTAYRALGQADLRGNGVNRVEGLELNAPGAVALDSRAGKLRLYVADTLNHRVLAWEDTRSFRIGDPPTLILGQPSPRHSNPMGIGPKGFAFPVSLSVDPFNGNLYVVDFGNNRVLRFSQPFENTSRVEPDAVYGQPNFTTNAPNSLGVTNKSMNSPRAMAFDASGNLWVADSGNHRVLRFNAAVLSAEYPAADVVLGQPDSTSSGTNRSGPAVSAIGFDLPAGLAFDLQGNLYVADFNNARVLRFPAPLSSGSFAMTVYGQPDFSSRGVPPQASNQTLAGPVGVTVDPSGSVWVAVPRDNRILAFTANTKSGTPAVEVLGQENFTSTQANGVKFPRTSADSLAGVNDVKSDPDGNLYLADAGNNRVLFVPAKSKLATRVWGQPDFETNSPNQIKAGSLSGPFKIAIDYSRPPYPLYVSDTRNHRVLVWLDALRFRTGDSADLVIGQADFRGALPNSDTGTARTPWKTSLSSPKGIAVDAEGNLYVADSDNNRVLRFPRPVDQPGRISADLVIGQVDFTSSTSAAVTRSSLRAPTGVAISPAGTLFVADTGNNRVLEFPLTASSTPAALRVYGQPDFTSRASATADSAQTLRSPLGVCVDGSSNLYVVDSGANRLLIYTGTQDLPQSAAIASIVIGQPGFDTVFGGGGPARFAGPSDCAVDRSGTIYVSDAGQNRVLAFPSLLFIPVADAVATSVVGQRDLFGTGVNWNTPDGLATSEGLFAPMGLFLDRRDTLYVADTGNNRAAHFLKPLAILHAASPQTGLPLAQGGLAKLTGTALADRDETAGQGALPLSLAEREVALNDELPAPLVSVASSEINLQVPSAAPVGLARIAVRFAETGELLAGSAIAIASSAPGLFSQSEDGKGQGKVRNADGSDNSVTNPAARGTMIRLFGTGQGPVTPELPDGQAAPENSVKTVAAPTTDGSACLNQQPSVCVAIGSTFGEIQFSGLAAGVVGVWQLDVKIPDRALTGPAIPVRAVINGKPSNIVTVAIK